MIPISQNFKRLTQNSKRGSHLNWVGLDCQGHNRGQVTDLKHLIRLKQDQIFLAGKRLPPPARGTSNETEGGSLELTGSLGPALIPFRNLLGAIFLVYLDIFHVSGELHWIRCSLRVGVELWTDVWGQHYPCAPPMNGMLMPSW